ncbi:MAG TPA: hypothetical protein VLE74_04225 [Candidatus Saccharimonadales bacterium]|nr:hypothetical protein [Candidatus Saccharimonadales bacterium]
MKKADSPELGPKKLGDTRGHAVTFMPERGTLDMLKGLAVIDQIKDPEVTLADEMRGAVQAYVDMRRSAPTFQTEVKEAMESQEHALTLLNHEQPTER